MKLKSLAVARCAILKEMKYYWRLTELEIYVEMVLGEEWRLIKAFAEADGGSHEVRSPKDSKTYSSWVNEFCGFFRA